MVSDDEILGYYIFMAEHQFDEGFDPLKAMRSFLTPIISRERQEAAEAANAEIERLSDECETERMRLAVCGVAALGYFDGCKDEYRSASLNDVLQLRSEIERLRRELEEAKRPDENLAWALNSGDGVYRP